VTRERPMMVEFTDLEEAARNPGPGNFYTNTLVRIKGQFSPSSGGGAFSLVRLKMTCCAADARPLNVIIEAPGSVSQFRPGDWINVEGRIEFRESTNRNKGYVTVLKVPSLERIRQTSPARPPYLQ
jgi:uncharacterized protein DUF1980